MGLCIGPIWKLSSALAVDCHTSLCFHGHPQKNKKRPNMVKKSLLGPFCHHRTLNDDSLNFRCYGWLCNFGQWGSKFKGQNHETKYGQKRWRHTISMAAHWVVFSVILFIYYEPLTSQIKCVSYCYWWPRTEMSTGYISPSRSNLHFYSAPIGERSIAISLSVCLSVHEHISGTTGPIFTKFCMQIPCGCGSVLL